MLDGDEVNLYGTSPLLEDTDGDTIEDGDEIKLKLDPTKTSTDGIMHDSKRSFKQELSKENMPYKLIEESNLFIPSISVSCTGVADKRIEVKEEDNDTLLENRAIIGSPIKIKYMGNDEIECVISYDYKNYVNNWGKFNLKSFILCKFDGEDFIPINTVKDEKKQQLYAKVKGEGTYFLLNVEEFLNNVGINIEYTQGQPKVYSTNNAKVKDKANTSQFKETDNPNDVPEEWYQEYHERTKNNILNSTDSMNKVRSYSVNSNDSNGSESKGQADITFVIDTTGSMWGAM